MVDLKMKIIIYLGNVLSLNCGKRASKTIPKKKKGV